MRRNWKLILVIAAFGLVALMANAIVISHETRGASADVGRVLALPGPDLQVREDGRGGRPVIVLLHGLVGSIRWWDRLVPHLGRRHRVIRVDLVGHGGSEKPGDGYDPPSQAAQVARALQILGVKRAVVVGHSLGGVVATALAERNPELIRGLVLLGTPPDSASSPTPFLVRVSVSPVVGQIMRRIGSDGMIRSGLEDAFGSDTSVPQQFIDDFRDTTFTSYTKSREEWRDWLDERSAPERLRSTVFPLLAIDGGEDEIVKPEAISDWRAVPGAQTSLLPGIGHSPHWEAPDRTAKLILDFATSGRYKQHRSRSRKVGRS
jgi:pimeloyl-ACP methyl ester carboxylesterase